LQQSSYTHAAPMQLNRMLLLLFLFMTLSWPVFSQQASVVDDILYIPYLSTADAFYSAEFLIIPASDPIQLELLAHSKWFNTNH